MGSEGQNKGWVPPNRIGSSRSKPRGPQMPGGSGGWGSSPGGASNFNIDSGFGAGVGGMGRGGMYRSSGAVARGTSNRGVGYNPMGGGSAANDPFRGFTDGGIAPGVLGDFADVMGGEVSDLQDAADRHFERTMGRENEWSQFLDGIGGSIDRIDTQDPTKFASVQRAEQALKDFEDRTAADMSSAALGIREQLQGEFAMVQGGMRPDGSPMSPSEMDQARYSLSQKAGRATQQTLSGIMSNYNQQKAQMGMNVASLTNAAEQWNLQAQQINAANQVAALNLEAQGRAALAQYTLQNSESLVSKFQGMLQLLQVGMMPGMSGSSYTAYTGLTSQR